MVRGSTTPGGKKRGEGTKNLFACCTCPLPLRCSRSCRWAKINAIFAQEIAKSMMGARMLLPGARLSKGVPFGCLVESGVLFCCPKAVNTDSEWLGTAQRPPRGVSPRLTDGPCPCKKCPPKLTRSN